jgi:rhomboid protease GluP
MDRLRSLLPGEEPVSTVVMLVCLGQYLLVGLQSGGIIDASAIALLRNGANWAPYTFAGGEWWRLITYAFLHGGLLHLFFNGWILSSLGPSLEQRLGSGHFGALYVLAAVVGGLASASLGGGISVGASGAVMGLLGSAAALAHFEERNPRRRDQIVFIIGLNLLIGFAGDVAGMKVDNWCHLGGLFAGLAWTFAFVKLSRRQGRLLRRLRPVGGLLFAASVGAVLWQHVWVRDVAPVRVEANRLSPQQTAALWHQCSARLLASDWPGAISPCRTWQYAEPFHGLGYATMAALYEVTGDAAQGEAERAILIELYPDAARAEDRTVSPEERLRAYARVEQ